MCHSYYRKSEFFTVCLWFPGVVPKNSCMHIPGMCTVWYAHVEGVISGYNGFQHPHRGSCC